MKVPFNDLLRHSVAHQEAVSDCLERVARSGWYILGPEVDAFEKEFAHYLGVAHTIGLNSGTDALELALKALGLGAGDRVIAVANAGPYSSCAIRQIGAEVVYVDVDFETRNVNLNSLERALETGVQSAIITHLYGHPADLKNVSELMQKFEVPWIEDCAQSHGARRDGLMTGTVADIGCFSFYPTKNLGALGDAGACVTHSDELNEKLRRLRQYGWKDRYRVVEGGGRNSRMDEIQAAVLRLKLQSLDDWNLERRDIAKVYFEAFENTELGLPPRDESSVYHLFVVTHPERERLRRNLAERAVATAVHYPVLDGGQSSQASRLCEQVLSLPCFPGLEQPEVDYVVEKVLESL